CATSWSLRTLREQPAPTGTATGGAVRLSTSDVFVRRTTASAGEPAGTRAAEQFVWPTQPGGAWLSSSPHASLTSLPWANEPSIAAAAGPAGLPTLTPRHDVVHASAALTVMCSAESQTPLSWM